MIKKILTIAVVAAAASAFSTQAQEVAMAQPQNKMYQPREFTEIAFEGILLDVDQQSKINAINDKYKSLAQEEHQVVCDSAKCDKASKAKCDKADKAKGDKAKCDKADKKDNKHMRRAMPMTRGFNDPKIRKAYSQEVKKVLTPEQYETFLENIAFADQPPMEKGMKHTSGHVKKANPKVKVDAKGEKSEKPMMKKQKK